MASATQSDLFLAILALDAYNRGFNPGMTLPANSDLAETQIGNATIQLATPDTVTQSTSFYAIAYSWNNNGNIQTVISYRGTAFQGSLPNLGDLLAGYNIAQGFSANSQVQLALKFYDQVALTLFNGPIELTGHSLGGGLAGFVSDVTGAQADVFDNIPFGSAVVAEVLTNDIALGLGLPSRPFIPLPATSSTVRQFITNGEIATAARVASPALSFLFFQNGTTSTLSPTFRLAFNLLTRGGSPFLSGLAAGLATYGSWLDNTTDSQTLSANVDIGGLSQSIGLHSQALMVLLLYANVNDETAWAGIGQLLYDALNNDSIGNAIGLNKTQSNGWYTASDRVQAAIAYSAVSSGVMPFGDIGIQSLFADADTLGGLESAGLFTGLLAPIAVLPTATGSPSDLGMFSVLPQTGVGALAEIAVQFAGDEAVAGITNQSLASGAFSVERSVLQIDLNPEKWTSTFSAPASNTTDIVGLGDLFDGLLANIASGISAADPTASWVASEAAGFSASLLHQLNDITQVDIALGAGSLSAAGTLSAAHDGTAGGALLIGQLGQGSITGSAKGSDIIVGGSQIIAGDGNDLILAGNETVIVGKGNNQILADSPAMNLTLTYSGAALGAPVSSSSGSGYGGAPAAAAASAGTDVIIGNSAGGDTFTFTDANKAAFTVVWGGSGNDTFNFLTSPSGSAGINVVEMNMSGISGDNLTNLNATRLESYVDAAYGLSSSQPTFVILNPATSDKLTFNGMAPDTPTATLSSTSWQNADFAGQSNDPTVIADENGGGLPLGPDPMNPLKYLTLANENAYIQAAFDSKTYQDLYNNLSDFGLFSGEGIEKEFQNFVAKGENPIAALAAIAESLAIDDFEANNVMLFNTWIESSIKATNYELASSNFEYQFRLTGSAREVSIQPIVRQITTFGSLSDPTSPLQQHIASGGTSYLTPTGSALNLIGFNPGDFGIGLPQNGSAGTSTVKSTEYEVLQGWAQGVVSPPGNGVKGAVIGTSPLQLGAIINSFNQPSPPSTLYDPNFADPAFSRTTVDISQFLSGTSASDPTNVSVNFFASNQALLDGQFDGFTVLDSAADVSSAFDVLNADSKLTGITLTDSGTPTLTLTTEQAFNDTNALGEITNASFDVAIADTAADVSQNIDDLNADQSVTSITLTDSETPVLTLTALQALDDTSALSEISNTNYTIAISDVAGDVAANIDALNSDAAVSSITLTDSGTPAFDLTVAQTLGDTKVLGEITNAAYSITVEDTAATILANAPALSDNANVTGAIVTDNVTDVLNNAAALSASTLVTSITVVDTAANLLANQAALEANAKVTSMVVVDTAANVLDNAAALSDIAEVTGTGVADTAANISANIDALNSDAVLDWVTFTDSGTPTLTLTAAEAVNDANVLTKIASGNYAIDIVDTAAAVTANIDALSKIGSLATITLTDTGTPTVTVTAAQAINDAATVAKISNGEVVVIDTAADVIAQLDALSADQNISAITLTDAGIPTLALTVAQALNDTAALSKIDNANVQIVVSDTAADVSASFDALNSDKTLSSIDLTDSGRPTLVLTASQTVSDTGLLAKISNSNYTIAIFDTVADILANSASLAANGHILSITAIDSVANILGNSAALANAGCASQLISDSAANVAANIGAINADGSIKAISLTDSGTPTLDLTVAQTIDDAATVGMIANSTFAIDITDTAANVFANVNSLAANDLIASVTLTDAAGAPTVSMDVGELVGDAAFLAKITNPSYVIDITGTAADVSANLDALNANSAVSAITLTDLGTPVLNLSVTQALDDTNALGLITNASYTIAVSDTAANMVANAAALAADAHVSSISVVDTAANVLSTEASLAGNPLLSSITVVDTAANVLADQTALANDPNILEVEVVDTAANVAANFDALNADTAVSTITLNDTDPVLTLTAQQAADDFSAFFKITNSAYSIAVVDTAADVSQYLGELAFNPNLVSITLTDTGSPTLGVDSFLLGSSVLSEITNTNYTINLIGSSDVSVSQFVASQAILDGVPGGFGIFDFAANVASQIDALNADSNLTSIRLEDGGTPALTLTAAQVINDTQALGKIDSTYAISVMDTAANILANSNALASNGQITSLVVQDTVANVLSSAAALSVIADLTSIAVVDTASNVLANESALNALTIPISINVQDTAANVSAQIDQLNDDAALSSITLTDSTLPTLTLTVAQAVSDSNALGKIVGTSASGAPAYGIAVIDTAANISQSIDALSNVGQITSISVTDAQQLSLTLSVADALNDFNVLSTLSNATYSVTVVDTAANIQTNIDSLSADPNISSITVQGQGAVIAVTSDQAALDAAVLSKIVNATVNVVNTTNISVAEFLSEQSAIDSIGASFSIVDTAVNVSNNLADLNTDPNLTMITLSGADVPTLALTAAQAAGNAFALSAITNPSYAIAITDTSAAIGSNFAVLSAKPQISSITLSDPGSEIPLTVSEWAAGSALLSKVTNGGGVSIDDTSANIAADLDALNSNPEVASITITDGGQLDLTVAQVLSDTTALGKITNTYDFIGIIDTAANVEANIDALGVIGGIAQLVAFAPGEGSVPIQLTVAEAMENRGLLTEGSFDPTTGVSTPVAVAIVDSAANVAAAFDLLNRDNGITSITLTDAGTAVLDLTAAQAANDTDALGKIVGSYTINIVPEGMTVLVADFLANQSALESDGDIVVSDSSDDVAQSLDALNADPQIDSIMLTDNGPLTVTAAQAVGDTYALAAIANPSYTVAVTDSAAAVSSDFNALNEDTNVTSITLTDPGIPTLTLTAAQALQDNLALGKIINPDYQIAVVDTAADVAQNIDALDADTKVVSVTLTDSSTLVLNVNQLKNDEALLAKVTNADLSITLIGTPFDGSGISADLDAINTDTRVTSLLLVDTPILTLTVAQALGDTTALNEIAGSFTIAINDVAANVAAQFDALNDDMNISSIILTDSGVPTLALTAAQVQDDTVALSKLSNPNYVLSVVGTGSETININQALQVSNFEYDAAKGNWQVDGFGLAETLSNVASVVDGNGQRFLLVGGGSQYTTAPAAVAAASDGDTILLTPASDAANVGTDGKTITVEDVGAVGSTPDDVPPMVTITSPAVATDHPSDDLFGGSDIISGKVIGYGTAIVAGQTVTLTDNGNAFATATVQADGTFTANVTFAYQGANSIAASVTDSFGNTGSSAPVVDLLDSVAPTVTITSAPEISGDAAQTITGTVVSGGTAAVAGPNANLFDNGEFLAPVTVQADGSFSVAVTLPNQGANSFVVIATDSYGNGGDSAAVVDTLDSAAPTVTILSTAGNTNSATQTITGTDTAIGQTVTLTDNGTVVGTAIVGSDGFFQASVTLSSEGTNSIAASVTDDDGNTVSATVVDTLDDVAPAVTVTSAAETSSVSNQIVTGTVTSGGAATVIGQTVILTDNGTTLATTTVQTDGTFSANVILANQGANTIVAAVTDGFGNTGSSAAVVDTLTGASSPTVTITSAAEASDVGEQTITGTATSEGAATVVGQIVTLTDNGRTLATATVQSNGSFSASVTLSNEGSNSIIAAVSDSFGNTGTSTAVVDTLDNIAPTVTITSPAETSDVAYQTITGTAISGGMATVVGQTVTLTDDGAALGTATVLSNGTFSANVTLPNQGTNSIVATVNDSFGNASNSTAVVDTLEEASGYHFMRGQGQVTVSASVGTVIMSAGVTADDLDLQSNGFGDLTISVLGDTTDGIVVDSDLTFNEGNVSSGLSQILLSDGTVINLENPLTFTWLGNSSNYNLAGSDFGANLFDITNTGSITLGNRNDGGNGENTIAYSQGSGHLNVSLNGGTGILELGAGITASDVDVQSNGFGDLTVSFNGDTTDSIVIDSDLTFNEGNVSSGLGQIQLSDGTVIDLENPLTFTWLGNSSNYNLTGSDFGANLFDITTGNGSITFGNTNDGGSGQNTIEYSKGDGHLSVSLNGGTGILVLGAGITASDLNVQSNGFGDLTIGFNGDTTDSIVISSDVTESEGVTSSGLSQIRFSDGTVVNTLDAFAPTISINSPAESSNIATQTISGTVSSSGTAVVVGQTVSLMDNGSILGSATVQSNGTFTASVTLPNEGSNSIVAEVSDSLGFTGSSTAVVDTLDNIAPTVTITSSAESGNAAAQTITGTVISGGAASVAGQTVILTDNGIALATTTVQADDTFTVAVTLPNEGANSIVATVSDSYGNSGSSAAVVDTLNADAPTVTITSAAEAGNVASQTIAGDVTSSGAAAVAGQIVTLTDNGTTLGTATVQSNDSFSANVTLLNQGSNSIVATVTDSLGNIGTSVPLVDTLDSIAPTVTITSSAETSSVAAQTINGTVASGGAAAVVGQTVTLTDNGAALGTATVESNGTFSANITLPNQGTSSIVASVTDSFGNTGSSAAVVDTLTSNDESVAIASEVLADDTGASSTDFITMDGQVTLTGTATAGSTVAIFDGDTDLGNATVSGTTWTFSTDLGEGTHQLDASATGSDGSTATSAPAQTIVVDDTPPDPIVTNFDPSVASNGIDIAITGTSEAGSTIQIFLDGFAGGQTLLGTTSADASGNWSLDIAPPSNSSGQITAVATDLAGNVGTYDPPAGDSLPLFGALGADVQGSVTGSGVLELPWQQDGISTVYINAAASDAYLQANGFGDVSAQLFGDTEDKLILPDDLTDQSGVVTSGVQDIVFSDGTVLNLDGPLTFTWLGNSNNFGLGGANFGTNVFDVTASNGSINFGNASQGGSGQNTINYTLGAGPLNVSLNSGTGNIDFGPGVTASDVDLQANGFGDLIVTIAGDTTDSIDIHNDLTDNNGTVTSGIQQLQFNDGTSINLTQNPLTFTWLGNTNNFGFGGTNFGTNVFDVTTANGSISFGNSSQGGTGQNIVNYALGSGRLDVSLNGGTGNIDFGAGVTASDVDLQANGFGDLIATIAGDTTDVIVIHNDLTDTNGTVTSGIQQIQFSDGTSINLTQNPLTFTWLGNTNNFGFGGTDFGTNVFDVTAANGSINFGNANQGGTGQNIINYTLGAGPLNVSLNSGTGNIDFGPGVTASDVDLQANGFGDLIVTIAGDTTDSIDVHNDLTDNNGTVTSGIQQIQFSDGTSINLTQNPLTFTWLGNTNNFGFNGTDFGTNVFDVTAANGSINFGNNSDGGGGQNIVNYTLGAGPLNVSLNSGNGDIDFGTGVTASDVDLQANGFGDLIVSIAGDTTDSIDVHNDLTDTSGTVTSGIQQLQFVDGSSINLGPGSPPQFTWVGTPNASLSGSNFGANTFVLGAGSESVTGGGTGNGGNGNNTYIASSNTGQATISANAAAGSTNELEFVGGITDENLWFQQSGNDLKIDLLGTNTQIDVSGWFNSSSNQLQEIMAGGLKIDSQISQLVQAMATYSANNAGFDPTASGSTVPNDPNLQAAVGAAWHA